MWFNLLNILNRKTLTAVLVMTLVAVILTACGSTHPQSMTVKKIVNPHKFSANTWNTNIRGSNVYETADAIEVYDGLGGFSNDWQALGTYAVLMQKTVKIHSNCLSACTVMAERVVSLGGKICLSSRAHFGFHMARTPDGEYISIENWYRPEVVAAVKNFPPNHTFTTIPNEVAKQLFERNCDKEM